MSQSFWVLELEQKNESFKMLLELPGMLNLIALSIAPIHKGLSHGKCILPLYKVYYAKFIVAQ